MIAVDERYKMDLIALCKAITADRKAGVVARSVWWPAQALSIPVQLIRSMSWPIAVPNKVSGCALAQYLALLVDDVPHLELMAPVELPIVCFRYVSDSLRGDEERLDALNKRIVEEVQTCGKAFVNGTILHGRFVLRTRALHYALTEDDVVVIIEEVCQVGAQCMMRSIPTDLGERFMQAFGNGPLPIGQQRDT
jgi:hypothetical protein